jgi:glyoxylate utilization-related uncharacterized protein
VKDQNAGCWIKTGEAKPEERQWVIVVHQTNYTNAPPHQSVSTAFYEHGHWVADGHAVYAPTHWQPFPEPPPIVK